MAVTTLPLPAGALKPVGATAVRTELAPPVTPVYETVREGVAFENTSGEPEMVPAVGFESVTFKETEYPARSCWGVTGLNDESSRFGYTVRFEVAPWMVEKLEAEPGPSRTNPDGPSVMVLVVLI
jgi:hypothetical protein